MAEHSAEMTAAIAAMRAEWARIGPEVHRKIDPELDEDEQSAMVVRRYELMRGFWDQHGAAVMALNPGMRMPDLAAVEAQMGEVAELEAKLQKAREDLLQKTADLAEARQVVEGLLARLAGLEALTPKQWAAMEVKQRGRTYEILRELQENRAAMLAELPAERRRHWEAE